MTRSRRPAPGAGCGVVAGLRLVADRRLAGCDGGPPIAGRLRVGVADVSPPGGEFFELPGERGAAWLRRDGGLLLLAGEHDWGRRVRRMVPYAAWLQGLPVLHAAVVEREGTAVALLAASGIGKSTLAERLSDDLGYRLLYDDLAPCRRRGGGFSVPRSTRPSAPLGALVFLERVPSRRPQLEAVGRPSALRRLARNGWGDLPSVRLWRNQFDFYLGVAASCPAFRLSVPDDSARLGTSARWAAALLSKA